MIAWPSWSNQPNDLVCYFFLSWLATICLNPCLCPWHLNRSLYSWSINCNYEGSTFCYFILRPQVLFPGFDYATICTAIQWPISLADMLAVNWLCVEWQLTCKSIMSLLNLLEHVKKEKNIVVSRIITTITSSLCASTVTLTQC